MQKTLAVETGNEATLVLHDCTSLSLSLSLTHTHTHTHPPTHTHAPVVTSLP